MRPLVAMAPARGGQRPALHVDVDLPVGRRKRRGDEAMVKDVAHTRGHRVVEDDVIVLIRERRRSACNVGGL
jgi:hypothetical protein